MNRTHFVTAEIRQGEPITYVALSTGDKFKLTVKDLDINVYTRLGSRAPLSAFLGTAYGLT